MKLPYRNGEWYELPLGDGTFTPMCIVRVQHHVVDVAVYRDTHAEPVAAFRVSDRALVLHRWKRLHVRHAAPGIEPENRGWIAPAHAERLAAARLGIRQSPQETIEIRDLRSGDEPVGSVITWRAPLDEATLERVKQYVCRNSDVAIRPRGAAIAQLVEFAALPVRRLQLTAPYAGAVLPNITTLSIERPMDPAPLLAHFPNLRAVRIAARDATVAFRDLPRTVRAVDCSGVKRVSTEGAPPLEALRCAYLDEPPDLRPVASSLRSLSLEDVNLHTLQPVYELPALEQLELNGMWQFDLADAEPLLALESLVRATVDIGGRRKNVELYKRARWAYPWPFDFVMENAAGGNTV